MELQEAILNRHSIRTYTDKVPSKNLLEQLITIADHAPSAGGLKSRRFITITDKDVIKQLGGTCLQDFIATAPTLLVACTDIDDRINPYGDKKYIYALMDVCAMIQNLLLLLHESGLGACWVGAFNHAEAKKILELPSQQFPLVLIPVGYPKETQ